MVLAMIAAQHLVTSVIEWSRCGGPFDVSRIRATASSERGWLAVAKVARAGVEPATFRFSGGRSYQLSYLASRRLGIDLGGAP